MASAAEEGTFDRGIRRLLLVVALVASVVVLYREPLAHMASLWSLSSYKHGYVIGPVCLYLLWLERGALARAPVTGSLFGVGACAAFVALYLVAAGTSVQVLQHAALVLMVPALVLAVLGWGAFRTVAFPLFFLLAAVPVGEELIPLLLEITADISAVLLRITGIPFLREGMFFTLPGGNFEIAEVCSGVRYLLAGGFSAVLFAYVNFDRWPKRLLFVALAAVGFVLANALRAYLVMSIASWTDGRLLGGRDHIYFGMVLFAAVLVALLWGGLRFADPPKPATPASAGTAPATRIPARAAVMGLLALLVLAVGPWFEMTRRVAVATVDTTIVLPGLAGCGPAGAWSAPWKPRFVGAAAESAASYDCAGTATHLYVARYAGQQQGRELAGKANALLPYDWRRYTTRSVRDVPMADEAITVNEAVVVTRDGALVVWSWYSVDGVPVRTGAGVKLREALAAFDRAPEASTVYVVATQGDENDLDAMRARLAEAAPQLWAAAAHPPSRLTSTAVDGS